MNDPSDRGTTAFDSTDCVLVEISDVGVDITKHMALPRLVNESSLLNWMRQRLLHYGAPVPDGYVPPRATTSPSC